MSPSYGLTIFFRRPGLRAGTHTAPAALSGVSTTTRRVMGPGSRPGRRVESVVARMSVAICGEAVPDVAFAHPGYKAPGEGGGLTTPAHWKTQTTLPAACSRPGSRSA